MMLAVHRQTNVQLAAYPAAGRTCRASVVLANAIAPSVTAHFSGLGLDGVARGQRVAVSACLNIALQWMPNAASRVADPIPTSSDAFMRGSQSLGIFPMGCSRNSFYSACQEAVSLARLSLEIMRYATAGSYQT